MMTPQEIKRNREMYEEHLARIAPGTPLATACARVPQGKASAADLVAYVQWELAEAMWSLPMSDNRKEWARPRDDAHANACTFRAFAAMDTLAKLLGVSR